MVQTIYIRRVEKVGGELVNVPFDKVENVKDPVKARMPKIGRKAAAPAPTRANAARPARRAALLVRPIPVA